MIHELNIFRGSLTSYQLSEALDIPVEQVLELLNGDILMEELCPDVIERIHQLEGALFGQIKN